VILQLRIDHIKNGTAFCNYEDTYLEVPHNNYEAGQLVEVEVTTDTVQINRTVTYREWFDNAGRIM